MMKHKSFHAAVVDQLAAMIIKGENAVGLQLPTEGELCASMGVSRTILREAVKTLCAKGMLVTGPRTGTRTQPPADWNLLDPDVTLGGGIAATLIALAALACVIAWGVTIGALASGTVIAITVFWMILYGTILLCSFLPDPFPSPTYVMTQMRSILKGNFDEYRVGRVVGGFLIATCLGAAVGLIGFRRKDV